MEKTTKIGYREVLGQKEYAKKLAANTINRLGDSIDVIAFQWLVYHITECGMVGIDRGIQYAAKHAA